MTAVAHDVPHGLEHATATGLDSRKLAIWTFIGSECMFFASLISNYVVNKGRSLVGPFPHEPWTSPSGEHFKPILEIPTLVRAASTARPRSPHMGLEMVDGSRG